MRHLLALIAAALIAASPSAASSADRSGAADAGVTARLRTLAAIDAAGVALGAGSLGRVLALRIATAGMANGMPYSGVHVIDLVSQRFADLQRPGIASADSGFDGSASWTRDNKGVVWDEGTATGRSLAVDQAFQESYALWTPSHGGAIIGDAEERTARGATFDVVRVKPPGSIVPFDVWIDRRTHLPARSVERTATSTTTIALADYRDVEGVAFPFEQRLVTSQDNVVTTRWLDVDDRVFTRDLARSLARPESSAHDFTIAGARETTVPLRIVDDHLYLDVAQW